jgi:O-antigen ligase
LPAERARHLEVALLAATAAAATVSIFAAQVGLALAGAIHAVRTIRRETRGFSLPADASVAAFTIWTLLSSAFASSPLSAQENGKKIVLFLLLYFAAEVLRAPSDRARILDALLAGGVALATLAVLQFAILGYDTLNTRPRSFLGHYMTASGVVMLVVLVAADRALVRPRSVLRAVMSLRDASALGSLIVAPLVVAAAYRLRVASTEVERAAILFIAAFAFLRAWRSRPPGSEWPSAGFSDALAGASIAIGAVALVLSRTRSAWLGIVAGIATLLYFRQPRLLRFLPAAVVAVIGALVVMSPRATLDRLTLKDPSSRDRYFMWQAGLDMILEKPLFGQGTGMILEVYPKFRWEGAPNPEAPHLHNNLIQVAAERGIPCALFLLWMLAGFLRAAWRNRAGPSTELGDGDDRVAEAPGEIVIASLVATLVAGTFEYNLGDSEILIVVLLLVALPFAARTEDRPHSPARDFVELEQ